VKTVELNLTIRNDDGRVIEHTGFRTQPMELSDEAQQALKVEVVDTLQAVLDCEDLAPVEDDDCGC